MNYQQLQEDFKSDLKTVSALKIDVISANDLYGSLLKLVGKLSLIFLLINTLIATVLHCLGLYYHSTNFSLLMVLWICALPPSLFTGLTLSQYVLFAKIVQGKLKTEAFIKEKYTQGCFVFLGMYSVLYLLFAAIIVGGEPLSNDPSIIWFYAIMPQFASYVISMVSTSFILSMEAERLSLGLMFEVINTFVNKMKRPSL